MHYFSSVSRVDCWNKISKKESPFDTFRSIFAILHIESTEVKVAVCLDFVIPCIGNRIHNHRVYSHTPLSHGGLNKI